MCYNYITLTHNKKNMYKIGDVVQLKSRTIIITEVHNDIELYKFIDNNGVTGFWKIKKELIVPIF